MSRTGIFASAKGAILGQTLSLLSSGIKAMPTSLYVPDYAAHTTMSDVPSGARVVAGVALANKSLVQAGTGYRFDADDTAFGGIPNPTTITGVVLYLEGGSDAASKLIGYFDYFAAVPVLVVSGTVTFSWPPSGIFVLDDGVLGGPQGTPGSLVSVADDIAKHVIGSPIDRVRGQNGVPFKNDIAGAVVVDGVTPPLGGAWTAISRNVGESTEYYFAPDNPVPQGWYDPRHYGAKFDGATDDYPAFLAMIAAMPTNGGHVHMPQGVAWLSQGVIFDRQIILEGCGGNDQVTCGVRVASGHTAFQLDTYTVVTTGGLGANNSAIRRVNIDTLALIHPTVHGNTSGRAIQVFDPNMTIRVGECCVRQLAASPTRCYRATAMTAGGSRGPTVLSGATAPAWNDTIGSSVTDAHGITWVTEALPSVHATSTAYAVGDRVFAKNDNRYLFECTTAGTSSSSLPDEFSTGTDGNLAAGATVGGTVVDGTVQWIVKLAVGVYCNSNFCSFEHLYVNNFIGAGLHMQGGAGQDARGTTGCDNFRIYHINAYFCGVGVAVTGPDTNGFTLIALNGAEMGTLHPGTSTIGTYPYPDGGRGGHILHDHSQASGNITDLYAQLSTGRSILKNGIGRGTYVSCFQELNTNPLFNPGSNGGIATIVGGNICSAVDALSSQCVILDPSNGRGIVEYDANGSVPLVASMGIQDGHTLFTLGRPASGDNAKIGWTYGYGAPSGYWALQHGKSMLVNAFLVASAAVGTDPCPGWMVHDQGYLLGDPTTASNLTFRGSVNAWTNVNLRGGLRRAGDEFVISGQQTRIVTSDGYKGTPWSALAQETRGVTAWALPGAMVEPTANTGTKNGGEKVFRCTTSGQTGSSEPDWSTATTVGNTVNDGTAVWTLVGFTPAWRVAGGEPVETTTATATTTATTANQVLTTFTLPTPASGKVDAYRVFVSILGGGNGGRVTAKVETSIEVSSAGAITRLGSDDVSTPKGSGAAASSTFNINFSGTGVQVRATPGTSISTQWSVIMQFEKILGVTA